MYEPDESRSTFWNDALEHRPRGIRAEEELLQAADNHVPTFPPRGMTEAEVQHLLSENSSQN